MFNIKLYEKLFSREFVFGGGGDDDVLVNRDEIEGSSDMNWG